ncbi:MAG: hypothetical protein NT062_01680 [Proteobacteria bacterium]|nr:hypothetical protein [Pseudomonadota bacterium]
MKSTLVLVTMMLAVGSVVGHAQPRAAKVLVLPIDGTTDPAVRKRLDSSVAKLATAHIAGNVTTGETTFAEAAVAVGCDPQTSRCVDEVIATLSVDELVWGTATPANGQTVLVVHRARSKQPPRDATIIIAAEPVDAQTETSLAPLFDVIVPASPAPPDKDGTPLPTGPTATRARNLGIALVAGGGVMALIALVLWSNERGIEDQIDAHPTDTAAELRDLSAIEDRAITYAVVGDLLMVVGLAAGGYGSYVLYQDHKTKVGVQPTTVDGGVGLSIGGIW